MKIYIKLMLLLALTSCSTVIEGRSQQLTVNTNPPGASCVLMRENLSLATVNPTPGNVEIRKTKHDITVECTKEGYQKASYFNKSDVAGATVGNVLVGGLIGWGVDSAVGADNKYETPMNITLVPEEKPEVKPAPKKKTSKNKEAAKEEVKEADSAED